MKKNKLVMKLWLSASILLLFVISIGCEKTEITDNLEVSDNYAYFDSRIIFSSGSPDYNYDGLQSTLKITTSVTVPNDVHITDYGYCWVILKDFNASPKISDEKYSFGTTELDNFTFSFTFNDDAYLLYNKFYYRAYIITDKGIIYDTPTYHRW